MKKFRFRLQKILDLREFEENEAKEALAASVAEISRINRELSEIARSRVSSANLRSGETNVAALIAIDNYIAVLDSRREELLSELAQAELAAEEKRAAYADAASRRKALDSLKDKKIAVYKKQLSKEEENTVDDIVTGRFSG
ncbi:MAG: flagellar export protein FliJ [Bacteroides sp.]|nr:flagellar export protein FliJ [Prevotella sp.]MCM1407420.1 flagellar export protein FliJ [Treponema brennaborense]MCM1469910.1 flagellar export protein FliJ [Bacteroides sp.]